MEECERYSATDHKLKSMQVINTKQQEYYLILTLVKWKNEILSLMLSGICENKLF